MRRLAAGALVLGAAMGASGGVFAQDSADILRDHLYRGMHHDGLALLEPRAAEGDAEARFGVGVFSFLIGMERLAQDLYRHGLDPVRGMAVSPLLGFARRPDLPADPLAYEDLRDYLETFVADLDHARALLLEASEDPGFAVEIDVMAIRIDIDGDGKPKDNETLGALMTQAGNALELGLGPSVPPATFAFDAADAIWLGGYSQILALQADFLLAHDFETFFEAALHRFFPGAGLPMEAHMGRGGLLMDPATDALVADVLAAIHTLNWPVIDGERLAGVRQRLIEVLDLSRRNWQAILAETDDHMEFLPSPSQTPFDPDARVTEEMVAAWHEALDTSEAILNGALLVPHWRFEQGFDLEAYFETAERTDLVMLLTGLDALPYLKDGPIASLEDFQTLAEAFGDDLPFFALWFN